MSTSLEEHKQHLTQVFDILQENKLYARLERCSFGQTEVQYLGHIINQEGVATDPSKIKAIQDWPAPTNITELRSFLGLSGYYRRFIQGYGLICRSLFDCLKKDAFHWDKDQDKAFAEVKDRLTHSPVLALPDFSKPFILEADACGYGLGAVLMQGRPISYFSKTIGPRAAALSTYDQEAMPIIEAVKKWKHYFLATALIIRTDQESLKYIQEQKLTEGIQHKLLLKLLGYNFTIQYKKGKENKAADALSSVKHLASMLIASSTTPTWVVEVVKSYSQDGKIKELIAQCTVNKDNTTSYSYRNGILRFKNKVVVGNATALRQVLLKTFHSSELGGHSGERATYQRVKLVFHWPGLKQDVIAFVKACPVCQINKAEHCPYPGLLEPLPVPDFAWAHVSIDFVEGLPLSENKDLILVVVDRFTKYAHFIAMKHPITVESVARAFSETIFKLHGMSVVIVTDRDKIFTSNLWQQLFKSLKIKLHISTSYHSQSDGQTERVNQCLENYLRCMCFQQPKKWHGWLVLAEWWYNTSFHTS